ncbi:MAG TPA: polyketide synthase, partial [Thermoanaerobaculia bacterium]|nr:polyketide synthase [Thermoanaerobaculia bacterium]
MERDDAPQDEAAEAGTGLNGSEVAVVGLAGRFPGAADVEAFWENLKNGVESVRFFSEEELLAAGVSTTMLRRPEYVRAWPVLDGFDLFDAALFNIPPREAQLMDPQHRLFLECAWEALERAGYNSDAHDGLIGVYAGLDLNTYLFNLTSQPAVVEAAGAFQTEIASDKDYLATRVSYKLDLRGPSLTVQAACATSLVAVHLACQGLLSGECDMALAGGASIKVPQHTGYLSLEGGIQSPDGHCRAFDARAQGTIFGSGLGIVVLKRLSDAVADGDVVHAVIKGSAINNDGALKIGYSAPGGEGQYQVVRAAQMLAEVDPATITYVEAHGTGTPLGDPIEVAALTRAFRASTDARGFCGIGSVKTNVGHLKSAAGVAGLIKAVLALEHKAIPPSLHLEKPSPHIDFASSPFYVVDRLTEWEPAPGAPRRAAVSSFGVGGTNAHIILEEAPPRPGSGPSRPWQLLLLSGNTPAALAAQRDRLAGHLFQHPEESLADVAFT